jgi:rRNA processing protein Krr1/Pno1
LLAILNEPSHGVGAEIFIASNNNIRVIGFYKKNVEVSRFIKGFINNKDGCSYYKYLNIEVIPDKFTKSLSSTNKKYY